MNGDEPLTTEPGSVVDELKSAILFLTPLTPRLIGGDPRLAPNFRRGARVFPIVGALIGTAGGTVLVAASVLGLPSLVAATLAVAATALVTGGLHEDGLADTADGLGGATVERKLEIMDDARVGTYGAVALVVSVLLRVVALAAIADRGALAAALALIAAEAVSRAALVTLWHAQPAARIGGLAHDTGPPGVAAMLTALAVAAAVVELTALPAIGLRSSVIGGVVAALATYMLARLTARAIGGRTGDTLGACQQVAVAGFLVGASAV